MMTYLSDKARLRNLSRAFLYQDFPEKAMLLLPEEGRRFCIKERT